MRSRQPKSSTASRARALVPVALLAVALVVSAPTPPPAIGSSLLNVPASADSPSPGAADGVSAAREAGRFLGSDGPSSLEMGLFDLVNRDRASHGLPALEYDPDLLGLARERALAQRALPDLTHRDESGRLDFYTGLAARGLSYRVAGENLARVPFSDGRAPEIAESALMNSESHRAIILLPGFQRLAVGHSFDTLGRTVFSQIFRGLDPPPVP